MRYTVRFKGKDVTYDVLDNEIVSVDGSYILGTIYAALWAPEDHDELRELAYSEADRDETDRLMERLEFSYDDD